MVNITPEMSKGEDEIWAEFFCCPRCGDTYIIRRFEYCPNCGVSLHHITTSEITNDQGRLIVETKK